MRIVGVAELKAKLSRYLAHVQAGGEVLVTDRGRPIARLVPATGVNGRLADLERDGLVRIGSGSIPDDLIEAPRPEVGASVLEALLEERREGR